MPPRKVVVQGLGLHRVVAEHPARYTNPQVVLNALRAVKARLEIEDNPKCFCELKKLEDRCVRCLQTKRYQEAS